MFNSIIVGADGSNHAQKAVSIAADLASRYDTPLTILHVSMHGAIPKGFSRMLEVEHINEKKLPPKIPKFTNIPETLAATLGQVEPDIAEQQYFEIVGNAILAESKKNASEQGAKNVETVMVNGDAAEKIVECANEKGADLIVMGTRGLGELKGLLMGSVSHKVSQLADCPCLTVK